MQMKLAIAAILIFSLSACGTFTPRDDWSTDATVAEMAWQATNAIDAFQTAEIKNRPDLRESSAMTRRVIGRKPDADDTAVYFASMALSHYLISISLPARWRPWFQGASLLHSGAAVIENCATHRLLCD